MKKKKEHAVLLHILSALLVVAGITVLYNNPHYGEGLTWLSTETYEDTPEFVRQFKADIDSLFNYVEYKEYFEKDGKLAYDNPVVSVENGPGQSKVYTIDEMVRKAKSYGFYLNDKFKVTGGTPIPEGEQENVKVEWRSYDPDHQDSEPGESFITMDELASEVLSHLGNYYSFYYQHVQNPSNFKFIVSFTNTKGENIAITNTVVNNSEDLKTVGRYIHATGEALYNDTNLDTSKKSVSTMMKTISPQLEQINPFDTGNYFMTVAVNTSYSVDDIYSQESAAYDHMRIRYMIGLVCLIIGLIGCAASLYYMICLSGHENSDRDAISLGRIDRISAESCTLLFGAAAICALFLGERIGYKVIHLFLSEARWYYGELVVRVLIFYTIGLAGCFSLIRRYKAGTLWTGSLTRKILSNIRLYIRDHRFTTRLTIGYTCFVLFNFIVILTALSLLFQYDSVESKVLIGLLFIFLVCMDLWVYHQMYRNASEVDLINEALLKISKGDTSYKVEIDDFGGKEKDLAEHINHISRGLETALQEKVRSERLKADLITNVSHDIKTPLTSIINYVDLIKREHIKDPKIQGYLDVLEQKAQRLKTLTEDLVEASKASSGNLKLDMASIDFVELIWQTNGEFEEKFAVRHLELVPNLPDESIVIQADGRHLWRVLENLYNNAFKYAMERSRVYVDIVKEEERVVFTIKNISENPLNIHPDELTERFVRGDVARTTEGSGLGLSIAKSLTELQDGEFEIYIDGDLFKVQIAFKI